IRDLKHDLIVPHSHGVAAPSPAAPKAHLGCTFQGPRSALHSHLLWECAYRTERRLAAGQLAKQSAGLSAVTFQLSNSAAGRHDLGVSFSCIVIQEIYMDGLVAIDGRLRPGDQILEVNGEDVTRASHSEARLYVLGLVEGGLAQLDGRLRRDDRILEINGVDIRGGTQAEAAENY
uniref:PDZ domain-containing protein n=1 Tax=Macrostomum lignano TaxID=282301 RepID=A0A1I8F487_9PLAT